MFNTKGMSKRQNNITWQRFKLVLNSSMDTYDQYGNLELSAYYDKRWVLPDGIHTEPTEFYMR